MFTSSARSDGSESIIMEEIVFMELILWPFLFVGDSRTLLSRTLSQHEGKCDFCKRLPLVLSPYILPFCVVVDFSYPELFLYLQAFVCFLCMRSHVVCHTSSDLCSTSCVSRSYSTCRVFMH